MPSSHLYSVMRSIKSALRVCWHKIENSWWTSAIATLAACVFSITCASAPPAHLDREAARKGAVPDLLTSVPTAVPKKPFDWQKRPSGNPPRCGPKEVLLFGACYRRTHPDDYSPPCEAPTFQHERTCYYPIEVVNRPPTSIDK